jgi:cytochrome c oxidase assembly protein subunit 20
MDDDNMPGWGDAVRSVSLSGFRDLITVPCVRMGLMVALASGFLGSGVAWVTGRAGLTVVNAGMASWMVTGPVSFVWCDWQRRADKRRVRVVKEAWEEVRAEKKERWERWRAEKLAEVDKEGKGQKTEAAKSDARSWWRWGNGARSVGREG